MDCRVKPGNDELQEQAIPFSRCDPHPSHRHATRISPLSAPTFAREHRRWTPVSSRSALRATKCKNGRKARKRNADRRVSNLRTFRVRRAQSAARSPLGVPPRLSANGTIHPKAQPGPGFVTHQLTRRVPRQPVWHFQRCTSRAGRSAGRLMPRPPGSGSDEPPPAGTASRSALRGHRITSLYASEIETPFSNLKHEVKAFRFVQRNRDVTRIVQSRRVTHLRKRFADSEVMPVNQWFLRFLTLLSF